jgi:hypothetical protein
VGQQANFKNVAKENILKSIEEVSSDTLIKTNELDYLVIR